MKKKYLLFVILFWSTSFLTALENTSFIELANNITMEQDLYDFLTEYIKDRSFYMVNYSERNVLNPEKYYDDLFYGWYFFPDDNFYLINKISVIDLHRNSNISDFDLKRGVKTEITISLKFIISDSYTQTGLEAVILKDEIYSKFSILEYSNKKYSIILESNIDNYNWVISADEDLLVEKLKKGEINVINTEDENHYTERN